MNAETAKTALSLLEQGEAFAWVTILDTSGSSPRHTGAAMLVRADGSIAGTIGGGPLEAGIIERAVEVVESGGAFQEHFDSARLGMACGGGGDVLIERVGPTRPVTFELFRGLVGLLDSGRKGWLVTVAPEKDGPDARVRRCLVGSDGSIAGDPVSDPDTLLALAKRGGTYDRILAGDPGRTHVQSIGARGSAYIFGAGHCGEKLAPVLSAIGFFTVIIDDRPDFANRERFPTADRIVIPESFDGVVQTLPIDDESHLVIVTRGHSHDTNVLAQALRTNARYIGMIGSKKKVAEAFRVLGEQGLSSEDLARVHAPIGLSIGAETPEEIAISIAAQLIQVRAVAGG
jgi:xanthine dehydrogenase accessory factor